LLNGRIKQKFYNGKMSTIIWLITSTSLQGKTISTHPSVVKWLGLGYIYVMELMILINLLILLNQLTLLFHLLHLLSLNLLPFLHRRKNVSRDQRS
jgi:hypothetical protein